MPTRPPFCAQFLGTRDCIHELVVTDVNDLVCCAVLAVVMLGVNCTLRLLVFPPMYKVRSLARNNHHLRRERAD